MKGTTFLVLLFILSLLAFGATQVLSGKLKPIGSLSLFRFQPQLDIQPSVSINPNENLPKIEVPEGLKESDLSPYYGQVKISSFSPNRSFGDKNGFTLSSRLSGSQKLSITGWQVKANHWDTRVPAAAGDYPPYGLLSEGDIVLENGGTVRAQYGVSPIGKNFRPNICSNYLKQTYEFDPALPSVSCPASYTREEIATAAGACQSLLLSIQNACRPATTEETSRLTYGEFKDCEPFLKRLNYVDCYSRNRDRDDFHSKDWVVWLKYPVLADKEHDQIFLLDNNGLVVDRYIY